MQFRATIFLITGLGLAACSTVSSAPGGSKGTAASQATMQRSMEPLSAQGEQQLRKIIQAGTLSDLRSPNFSRYQGSVKEFYEGAGYKPAWSQNGKLTTQARELIQILDQAEQKGLDSKDYDGERWPERVKALESGGESEAERVNFDVALTVSGTRYISDLYFGAVNPKILHKDFDPERKQGDPGKFLREQVAGASNVKEALARVECPYPGYQRTLAALQKYIQMAKEEARDPLPAVQKPIEPGQTYSGMDKLVQRLKFLGDLAQSASVAAEANTYSGEVVEAVKRFQVRHGIEADGKLGAQTIMELNEPMSNRVKQLRLSLERWRWLPYELPEPPIIVNIPEFKLRAIDAPGKPALAMSVVVGKAMDTETPVLEEDMEYIVFWPYWNVPPSILRGEMLPKIAKDPSYLSRNGYEVATLSGNVVTDGAVSNGVLSQLRAGKLMVRQKPGPKNALGLIKFIFPNDNNVYLHSTPAQALFGKARRDFSHGCIRVEDPKALAAWVLKNNTDWTKERIENAFAAGKEEQVKLKRTIPVLVLYATALAEEDGRVFFLKDIYGHDKALLKMAAR
jgi:murein L,D-transpeptidase YcbB/YkuD